MPVPVRNTGVTLAWAAALALLITLSDSDNSFFWLPFGLVLVLCLIARRRWHPAIIAAGLALPFLAWVFRLWASSGIVPLSAWPWLEIALLPSAAILFCLAVWIRPYPAGSGSTDPLHRLHWLGLRLAVSSSLSATLQVALHFGFSAADGYFLSTLVVREFLFQYSTALLFAGPWLLGLSFRPGQRSLVMSWPALLAAVLGVLLIELGIGLQNPVFAYASAAMAMIPGLVLGFRHGGWPMLAGFAAVILSFGASVDGWPLLERIVLHLYLTLAGWLGLLAVLTYRQLAMRHEELLLVQRKEREAMIASAALDERYRQHVASELHDAAGQTLIAIQLAAERLALGQQNSPAEVEQIRQLARVAADEVRTILRRLSAEDGAHIDLHESLSNGHLLHLLRTAGINASTSISPPGPAWGALDDDLRLVLYRVIQESVSNVLRHSGASHCHITLMLRQRKNRLRIIGSIRDNGVHRQTTSGSGFGLRGMKTRLTAVGGRFRFRQDLRGTSVQLFVELPG